VLRRWHRWVSIVAALFLAYVAITGALLAIDELAVRYSGLLPKSAGGEAPDVVAITHSLHAADLDRLLANTIRAARRLDPDGRITSVWLRVAGNITEGIVTEALDHVTPDIPKTRQLTFNADTGEQLLPDSPSLPRTGYWMRWDIHQIVKRLHRGDYFGLTGRWMSVATGMALLILASTGVLMYADMLRRRGRIGRRAWFWR
jgi:uncharacterized iron-regulated membrane protein